MEPGCVSPQQEEMGPLYLQDIEIPRLKEALKRAQIALDLAEAKLARQLAAKEEQ